MCLIGGCPGNQLQLTDTNTYLKQPSIFVLLSPIVQAVSDCCRRLPPRFPQAQRCLPTPGRRPPRALPARPPQPPRRSLHGPREAPRAPGRPCAHQASTSHSKERMTMFSVGQEIFHNLCLSGLTHGQKAFRRMVIMIEQSRRETSRGTPRRGGREVHTGTPRLRF